MIAGCEWPQAAAAHDGLSASLDGCCFPEPARRPSPIPGGIVPDLRAAAFLANDFFYNIVLEGLLEIQGMVSFKENLSRDDATDIRNYIIHRANQDKTAAQSPAANR